MNRHRFHRANVLIPLGMVAVLFLTMLPHRARGGEMVKYESQYYTIYSDLDPKYVREAALRMSRMAEEYHTRLASFSGVINSRLPFYLYESIDDYHAGGGPEGSIGVFKVDEKGSRLMATAGKHPNAESWHVVQHEGFHQFAHAVIHANLPAWLNEGLAEYFGESIFTGDGFVTGNIPPWRLAHLKEEMEKKQFKTVSGLMNVSQEQWLAEADYRNYDQAWSMTYFLIHADNGKYEPALSRTIREAASGTAFNRAWTDQIGPTDGFEERWAAYWKNQPESPTSLLYSRANCATLTSFLARAFVQKQNFDDFHAFFTAAGDGSLKIVDQDWLPPALLESAVRQVESEDAWMLVKTKNKNPALVLKLDNGTLLTGTFTLFNDGRVQSVNVEVDDLQKLLDDGAKATTPAEKTAAKAAVAAALRDHPNSPAAADAKKFLHAKG